MRNIKNELKAKSRQQLAYEYGISISTFRRWLNGNNIKLTKGLVTPKEQKVIYDHFGQPFILE